MSKKHPDNGPTFTKGKRDVRRVRHGKDDPHLDPSKPELWVSPKSREILDEWIKDLAKMPEVARKWTNGRP
jgi:hypothetical protein